MNIVVHRYTYRRVSLGLLVAVFLFGFIYACIQSGIGMVLFPDGFRSLPKERRIAVLREIGLRISPLRVRDILVSAYPNQPPEEHESAHIIGETAYAKLGASGFDLCDSSFTFACFHGVIFAAIKHHGYDQAVVHEFANRCAIPQKNKTNQVSCAHGVGHGIMWIKNYDYLSSYRLCDSLFVDEKLRFFCWDGVAMENVVRRGEMASTLPSVPWKPDNIYFPCDSIPIQYQPVCVREQVFLVRLSVFNRDLDRSIEYCLYFLSDKTRRECFGALGGALNQDEPNNPAMIIHECGRLPLGYDIHCISVAASHMAYGGDARSAQDTCTAITTEVNRLACIKAIEGVNESRFFINTL